MAEAGSGSIVRPGSRRGVAEASLWYAAVAVVALRSGYTMVKGSDLWWHLANGRLILETRSIPLLDSWSFTSAGRPWLQHEWLADLGFAAWSAVFGVASLVYWKWLTLVAVFALLFRASRGNGAEPALRFAAVALAAATAAPFLDIRPHLVSLLGLALLLALDLPRREPPAWLPAVFVVWANAHGGFAFGLAALALLLAPAIRDVARRRRAVIVLLACVLCCALNPSGVHALSYPLRYAFDRTSPFRVLIQEWAPPWRSGGIRAPVYPWDVAAFVAAVAVSFAHRRPRRIDGAAAATIALALLTLAMSLTSRRFIPLFALAAAPTLAESLHRAIGRWVERAPRLIPPALALGAGLWLVSPFPVAPYAFHYLVAEFEFPVDTCDFIEANGLSGNVFALWNWGGYLHFRTHGRMKVFADGRADTVFDDATLLQYAAVQYRRDGWRDVVERSQAIYVLWPRDEYPSMASELVSSGGWRILHVDAVSILLARKDQNPPTLRPPPPSPWSHLAEGSFALQKGDHTRAEAGFQSALQQMPWLRPACYGLVESQMGRGAQHEARQALDRCQALFPDAAQRRRFHAVAE